MPWLKSEGRMPRNDKVWELSDAAYRLYDAGRHYAVENLTDGHVPSSRISALTPKPATKVIISEILKAKLWHLLPDICEACIEQRKRKHAQPLPKTGFVVHDFLVYNPTRREYERDLEQRRLAGRAGGTAKGHRFRSESLSGELSEMPSGPLSEPLSESSSGALSGELSEMPSGTPSPYPVLRTPVPVAIATRTPARARGDGDAARSSSLGTTGLRPLTNAIGRVTEQARARAAR